MMVRVRRRGSYRLEFWVPQYRKPRVVRAIAQTGNLTTVSNEATVMTPTRLEPAYFEFVLPKTRVVQEVRVNGRAQPKRGMPVSRGDYVQWAAGAGVLALWVVRPLPDDAVIEVVV